MKRNKTKNILDNIQHSGKEERGRKEGRDQTQMKYLAIPALSRICCMTSSCSLLSGAICEGCTRRPKAPIHYKIL